MSRGGGQEEDNLIETNPHLAPGFASDVQFKYWVPIPSTPQKPRSGCRNKKQNQFLLGFVLRGVTLSSHPLEKSAPQTQKLSAKGQKTGDQRCAQLLPDAQ